jgi:hypothetical protein
MIRDCRAHLAEAGETYAEHFRFAATVALVAIGAGLACLLHALVPSLCRHTCSTAIGQLHRLFQDRGELDSARDHTSGVIVLVGLLVLSSFASAPLVLLAPDRWWSWTVAALAFAVPVAFLSTNPQLDPV